MQKPIDLEELERKNAEIIEKYISGLPYHKKGTRKIGSLKERTLKKYRQKLPIIARKLAERTGKTLDEVTQDEVKSYVDEVINKDLDYAESTKWDYRKFINKFFSDTRGPKFVEWLQVGRPPLLTVTLDDMLTEDEKNRLREVCKHPQDRAMVETLLEAPLRPPHEFISLKIGSIIFDEVSAIIQVQESKTNVRPIRVVTCAPHLQNWIENHPLRGDRNAPLWISLSMAQHNKPLSGNALRARLKQLAGKKGAHIEKPIWSYLFRHMAITQLATFNGGLNDANLKEISGWSQDSKMAVAYSHLSGKNTSDAVLRLHGIKKDESTKVLPRKCAICGTLCPAEWERCRKCGKALTLEAALRLDQERQKELDKERAVLSLLADNFPVLRALIEGAKSMSVEEAQTIREYSKKLASEKLPTLEELARPLPLTKDELS